MLILTRKCGETIAINDDIKVKILQIDGGQVRVGIIAPRSVMVHREEVYQKILEENRKASAASGTDVRKIAQIMKGSKNVTASLSRNNDEDNVADLHIAGAA